MALRESHPDYGHLDENGKNAVFRQICGHLRRLGEMPDKESAQFTEDEPKRARSEYFRRLTVNLNELLKTAHITRTFRGLIVDEFKKAYLAGIDEWSNTTDLNLFLDGQFSWIFTWSLADNLCLFDPESAYKFERIAFCQALDNYQALMEHLEEVLGKDVHKRLEMLIGDRGTKRGRMLDQWIEEFKELHGVDPSVYEETARNQVGADPDDITSDYGRF